MDRHVFDQFREIILRESGISLSDQKLELLANRIRKRLKSLQLSSAKEYLEIIQSDLSQVELTNLLNAISTNHTFFFRENSHFPIYADRLRELVKLKKGDLKTWCAASSSGEEPYSILMTAAESIDLSKVNFKLLATDISMPMLEFASNGLYSKERVVGVSRDLLEKYFDKQIDGTNLTYKVVPNLRALVLFKRLNLSKFPFPLQGNLDVIFCRNVMIYFDDDLRSKIVNEFFRLLNPGGLLFLGHSENISGFSHNFERIDNATFMKPGGIGK